MKKTAITFGDPNGIAPEIIIKALNFLDLPSDKLILITNKNILKFYKEKFNLSLEKKYEIIEIPFNINNINIGKETQYAGEFSFKAIIKACELAKDRLINSIVTAPVSKNAIKMAGYNFSGQTEIIEKYLADKNQKAEMIFIGQNFSVMLLTRHIALSKVSESIKKDLIVDRIEKLSVSLSKQINIQNSSFKICALNPHVGENGMFGDEEINEIIPAVIELKQKGINITGPYSADSLFSKCILDKHTYTCYIAMYHDQGLIPMKILEKDCINTTLGLDVIRTSPSHGTAYDIAGKNHANANSMINAIKLAIGNKNFL